MRVACSVSNSVDLKVLKMVVLTVDERALRMAACWVTQMAEWKVSHWAGLMDEHWAASTDCSRAASKVSRTADSSAASKGLRLVGYWVKPKADPKVSNLAAAKVLWKAGSMVQPMADLMVLYLVGL
jgi:hypothetical protein